jgi:hypothetical protein
VKRSCARCLGAGQQTKGRNKKRLEGHNNIIFEEISCNKVKKKREISGSQPENLDQIIYMASI